MVATDYEKQATDFLTRFGITFQAEYIGPDCPPWAECGKENKSNKLPCGGTHGGRYKVTLTGNNGRSIWFDFWNSYADEYEPGDEAAAKIASPRTGYGASWFNCHCEIRRTKPYKRDPFIGPPPYGKSSIIAKSPRPYDVLAGMSCDATIAETFEDWCDECGYDADSRNAEANYRRCIEHAYKLRRFFTTDELEALAEIQ